MKVLFQTYSLAFQSPGGGERVMLELQRALRSRGHAVEIYDPWLHDHADFDLVHYFSSLEAASWRRLKEQRPNQPLVVTPTLFLGRDARTWWRVQKEKISGKLPFLDKISLASALRWPDRFFPATSYEAESLHRYYGVPDAKLEVLPNGVNLQPVSPRLFREKFGLTGPYVLHVGRFHPVKQQDFLIRALRGLELDCVFVGAPDASFPDYLAHCRRLAEGGRFHFIPALPAGSELLASAYAGASLFLFPSKFETFGLAALEAAVCGTPLLLSDRVAEREVFAGCGKFLAPAGEAAWREEVQKFLQHPEKLPAAKQEALHARFDWDRIAERLEQRYRELALPQ